MKRIFAYGTVVSMLTMSCALLSPKGVLVELHVAECIASEVADHPEHTPEQIAIICAGKATPEILDLITKTQAAQARAAAKAGACK